MHNTPKTLTIFGLSIALSLVTAITACAQHPKMDLKQNFPSDTVLQMSFKSKIDGTSQPFLAKTPHNYDPHKKWPLLVVLHGLGDGPILAPEINSMLQIGPFGRGDLWYEGLGEQDVLECLAVAKKLFNVNEDRISLCGFSMGGHGTFKLGLKYPHLWAACVPVCGRCDHPQRITNALHLPFWIHTGSDDKVVSPRFSRQTWQTANELGLSHWKFTEHPGMGHSFAINWPDVEKWLLQQKRMAHPSRINFTTLDSKTGQIWWLEIMETTHRQKPARISAEIQGQTITLTTSNVSRYQLHLADAPLEMTMPITIIENERPVFHGPVPASGPFVLPLPLEKSTFNDEGDNRK